MNVSKRTWIILGVGLLILIAAFASLYIEKEQEIKDLVDEEETPKRKTKRIIPNIEEQITEPLKPETDEIKGSE